ncbi:hypothetical protein [Epilithonimonas zeae]|nr:hypothetical protein [Epilithonimonas zeae]UQB70461.1 hypothetical protein KI430_08550 [Epilithonimonas zeae]
MLSSFLAYMASEDPEFTSREKRMMPNDDKGAVTKWPEVREPKRSSKDY